VKIFEGVSPVSPKIVQPPLEIDSLVNASEIVNLIAEPKPVEKSSTLETVSFTNASSMI